MKAGEEVFCDYGYLDSFMESEAMIEALLDVGKAFSDKSGQDFNQEIKHTLKYIKNQVDTYKPVLDTIKSVAQMFK